MCAGVGLGGGRGAVRPGEAAGGGKEHRGQRNGGLRAVEAPPSQGDWLVLTVSLTVPEHF